MTFAILPRFEFAAVGRYGSKDPCVCECFLPCPRLKSPVAELGAMLRGDPFLDGSARLMAVFKVGREKFCRLLVLELEGEEEYSGRGGRGAGTCCGPAGVGRDLLRVRGSSSSSELDSTRRKAGRELVGCATMGEKLPGARC